MGHLFQRNMVINLGPQRINLGSQRDFSAFRDLPPSPGPPIPSPQGGYRAPVPTWAQLVTVSAGRGWLWAFSFSSSLSQDPSLPASHNPQGPSVPWSRPCPRWPCSDNRRPGLRGGGCSLSEGARGAEERKKGQSIKKPIPQSLLRTGHKDIQGQ